MINTLPSQMGYQIHVWVPYPCHYIVATTNLLTIKHVGIVAQISLSFVLYFMGGCYHVKIYKFNETNFKQSLKYFFMSILKLLIIYPCDSIGSYINSQNPKTIFLYCPKMKQLCDMMISSSSILFNSMHLLHAIFILAMVEQTLSV